ncbi:MAG: response regulator [Thioalkalivibrio sp.]
MDAQLEPMFPPRAHRPAAASPERASSPKTSLRAVPAQSRPVVLVAEHNRISQRLLGRLLERLEYLPCVVPSLDQALDMLSRKPGDFVMAILDLKSPQEGGLDLLRAWNTRAQTKRPPLIVLGNDARAVTREACREAGADFYLTEALRDAQLLRAVAFVEAMQRCHESGVSSAERAEPEDCALLDARTMQKLLELGGETSFLAEVFEDFSADVREHCSGLECALGKRDYRGWRSALHALKGAALGAGAIAVSELCREGERFDEAVMSRAALRSHLELIRKTCVRSQDALSTWLNRQGGGQAAPQA